MPISSALGSSALLPAGLGHRNKIINGNMVVAQRGTAAITGSSAVQYPVDRWVCQHSATNSVTLQQSTVTPAGFTNSIVATSGNSATAYAAGNYTFIFQYIEGYNIADLAYGSASAKQVSVSFWCRASQTGTYNAVLEGNGSTRNYVTTFTVNVANTWEYKTLLIPGAPSGTWLTNSGVGLVFYIVLGMGSTYETASPNTWLESSAKYGTSGAVDIGAYNGATFYLTGVQLEQNYQPTPFEQRPIGVELALCQRYYTVFEARRLNSEGYASSASYGYYSNVGFPNEMRVAPTITLPAATQSGNTAGIATNASVDGVVYFFGSAAAGNAYVLWNAGLKATASAEF